MDAEIAYKQLEQIVDVIKEGQSVPYTDLLSSISQVSTCVLENYDNSRSLIQRSIGLFEKCPNVAIFALLEEIARFIDHIQSYYSTEIEDVTDLYQRNSALWEEHEIKSILEKSMPLFDKEYVLSHYNERIIAVLTPSERKKFIKFAVHSLQMHGEQTKWSKDTIDTHYTYLYMLYSICKYDSLMRFYFHYAYNIIDRLPSSVGPQETRDFAESMLLIGHVENMAYDAYLCAAKAYMLCHNAVAGLLYLHIATASVVQTNCKLSKEDVYDVLWLMIKILRELPYYHDQCTNLITRKFKEYHFDSYEEIWFMHSVFFFQLKWQNLKVSEVLDCLDEHREQIMRNMGNGAIPWYTLLCSIEDIYPEQFNEQLRMYKSLFEISIDPEGNEKLKDILNNENLTQHLFQTIRQLEKTRNSSDYASDNKDAILIANKLLPKAVEQGNVGDFILAMRVKTDFTFVFEDTYQDAMYKKLELDDDSPGTYDTPYRHINNLSYFIAMEPHDSMIWIGECSRGSFYFMSLSGKEYRIEKLDAWNNLDIKKQNKAVSQLQYQSGTIDRGGYYPKSFQDFEGEDKAFGELFGQHILPIPDGTQRLLVVKDVEISSIPHNLLSLNNGNYIGNAIPSANVISTEFLIQSNFDNFIVQGIQPNFWIPLYSGDMALCQLWSHMESCLTQNDVNVFTSLAMDHPMDGVINIVCAHGAKTIHKTDWFYAGDQPIKDVDSIVGDGKLLILLVCHSGTMHPSAYDTAVHSIIKKFIREGYSSIVAPVWGLSTEIVPLWLNTFLQEFLNNKVYVIDAVFKANMAVKEEYKAISAWACMHLYGNPYLRMDNQPRLPSL